MNTAELKMKLTFNSLSRPHNRPNNPTPITAATTTMGTVGATGAVATTNAIITTIIISIVDDYNFPLTH